MDSLNFFSNSSGHDYWLDKNLVNYISNAPAEEYFAQKTHELIILGSTGSIGQNAIKIVKKNNLKVLALAAGKNIKLLSEQANYFKPSYLAILNEKDIQELKKLLTYSPTIFWGNKGFKAIAKMGDVVLSAQAGSAGVEGTLQAALAGKVIALANKETLAMAGGLTRIICSQTKASILPVDSEHFAIFQCLLGKKQRIKKLILTASGGPFLGKTWKDLYSVTPQQALEHPNWNMGKKISIDSATLMNKGLELIEATHLFGVKPEDVDIVIHPQSIIHSLVEFMDNSILGQLATPDMKLPIGDCLDWPKINNSYIQPLDLTKMPPLEFKKPDEETFKCLSYAKRALAIPMDNYYKELGINPACIIMNTANEITVDLFLNKKITFWSIPMIIGEVLDDLPNKIKPFQPVNLHDISLKEKVSLALNEIHYIQGATRQFVEKFYNIN